MVFLTFYTYVHILAAVRKNRYIILPIDFEEAWKVSSLLLFGFLLLNLKILSKP